MIFGSDEKNGGIPPFGRKRSCLIKESGVVTQRREVVKVGTLLLDNDKNNVIADNVLSYF